MINKIDKPITLKSNRPSFIILTAAIAIIVGTFWLIFIFTKKSSSEKEFTPNKPTSKHAQIVFGGDLMQHIPQVNAAKNTKNEYDYTKCFASVGSIFKKADLAILNLETTLNPKPYYTGYPLFRSPPQLADAMLQIGIDVAVLANNHICDNGKTGITYTTSKLDSLGINHTGAFIDSAMFCKKHPLMLTVNDIRIALLNYTYDTNGMPVPEKAIVNIIDTTRIADDLSKINRTNIDCIIVFFHWGDEYKRLPNNTQKKLAAFCHEKGVEIVMGSHPHVIQPFDTQYDKDSVIRKTTIYSLGNLVSNQRDRYKNGGLIVTLDLTKKENEPIEITPFYTPVWVMTPHYSILPPAVADTIPMTVEQRKAYQQFIDDTRKHLSFNDIFKEK